MRKLGKIVVGFAVLGFAVTACFYAVNTHYDPSKHGFLLNAFALFGNVILCPPILLFAWCIDCEYGTPAGLVTNLMIAGLLNAWLYATIGFFIACRGSKNSSTTRSADR